jgi:hypothetical protein
MQRSRPTGVTIIAILNIIGGIIMVIGGVTLLAAGAIIPMLPPSAFDQPQNLAPGGLNFSQIPAGLLGGGAAAVGGITLAIGILSFVVAYGLLKGRSWAWTLTVVLSVISIVLNAISLVAGNFGAIISIAISGIILYYMYRPHVKAYFGKAVTPGPSSATEA